MDTTWLGIRSCGDSGWELPVQQPVTGSRGQLFGGCGAAAACGLAESVSGRRAVWMTCQYIDSPGLGETVRLDASVLAEGKRMTQASLRGLVEDRECFHVRVALGHRSLADVVPGRTRPAAPPPESCDRWDLDPGAGGMNDRVEVRRAPSYVDRASTVFTWFRFEGTSAGDPMSVVVASDFFPPTLGESLGRRVYGASLDNSVRFVDRAECDWLLVEFHVDSLRAGIAHGTSHVWSRDGTLLAIATQTCAVSEF